MKRYYSHIKQLFPSNSPDVYKNVNGNSKFYITKLNPWKLTFWKQLVIAEDETKVSVILTNKYKVKAKNFVILISFYGNYIDL